MLSQPERFLDRLPLAGIERQNTAEAIHRLMASESDAAPLLAAVAQQIGRSIPFDFFGVSRFSLSSDHVSAFYTYTPSGISEHDRRWWPISPGQRLDYQEPKIIWEYDAYVRQRRAAFTAEPNLKKFAELNFLSALRLPVWREDRLVASVLLLSRKPHFYIQEYLDQLAALPLEPAVQLAMLLDSRRELEFRYELFRQIARSSGLSELASLIVRQLAEHYRWHHVAIFQVCAGRGAFELLAEHSEHPGNALPEANYEQPLERGVLGHVYATRTAVNIPDVNRQDLPFVSGWAGVSSEICLPLVREQEICWLLNADDRRVGAFSGEEENDLRSIAAEIECQLARLPNEPNGPVETPGSAAITPTDTPIQSSPYLRLRYP